MHGGGRRPANRASTFAVGHLKRQFVYNLAYFYVMQICMCNKISNDMV